MLILSVGTRNSSEANFNKTKVTIIESVSLPDLVMNVLWKNVYLSESVLKTKTPKTLKTQKLWKE